MTIAEKGAKVTYVVGIFLTQKATRTVFKLLGGRKAEEDTTFVALKRVA